MSRQSFIASMTEALGHAPSLVHGQPAESDLRAYFRTLRNNPVAALSAYRNYARSFYVHVSHATHDPMADVIWPGGGCDRWDELVSRPSFQHRRIIDCEGYALIAHDLLTEAGWRFRGYLVIYLPTRTNPSDFHIMAVLESPEPPARTVFIGSSRVSTSWISEANAVWPDDSQNARAGRYYPTASEAIEQVQEEIDVGAAFELAPLRTRRRSVIPPSLSE